MKASGNDAQALKEKVKFLESKLLEYEILQEEIGALSGLKIENEKLKKELMQKGPEGKTAAPAKPEAPAKPAPVAAPPPTVPSPEPLPEANTPAPPGSAGIFDTGQPASAEALAEGEKAAKGLESLLAQIDDLGGPPGKI